jgi:nucleoside-diphosphate-sugar epimerase
MAPTLFAKAITAGDLITVFNQGEMWRDFDYIDDIVDEALTSDSPPHALYNPSKQQIRDGNRLHQRD